MQFSVDEKLVRVERLPNNWWEGLEISHGSLEFANRFVRKITASQVRDREVWQRGNGKSMSASHILDQMPEVRDCQGGPR